MNLDYSWAVGSCRKASLAKSTNETIRTRTLVKLGGKAVGPRLPRPLFHLQQPLQQIVHVVSVAVGDCVAPPRHLCRSIVASKLVEAQIKRSSHAGGLWIRDIEG